MSITDKLNTIDTALDNIKAALIAKGQTPSGDITTYAAAVDNLPPKPLVINREVDANGKYIIPTTSFTFSLPNNAIDLGNYALYYAFQNCTGLTSIDLSSLTTVSGSSALYYAFRNCTGLTSIDLSSLTTVSGSSALYYAFQNCTGLTSIDLSSLTTISSGSAFSYAFQNCTGLTSVNLSSLTTLSGSLALQTAFYGCTGLTSVDLSSLTQASGSGAFSSAFYGCTGLTSVDLSSLTQASGSVAFRGAFNGCIRLTTLSFPALISTAFGSNTNQFNNMLSGVTGCTVHFPSNLQSVIGSWSDVTAGFGGTNTTVLFDLPATT